MQFFNKEYLKPYIFEQKCIPWFIKQKSKKSYQYWKKRYCSYRYNIQINDINKLLSQPLKPVHYDSERIFENLQCEYQPRPEYGYDSYSMWQRGINRVGNLMKSMEVLRKPGLSIFEAGCGDGMTGHAFFNYGHNVILSDNNDWREVRAKKIKFIQCDLCKELPYSSGQFDFVYSFNTFEHVNDPTSVLAELVRICKSGGYVYLEFGPLYYSPWGLHAYSTIRIPYSQFLFSKQFLKKKLNELGIYDLGKKSATLQPLNQWKVDQFEQLWKDHGCSIVYSRLLVDSTHLNLIQEFPRAFSGMNLSFKDVTAQAIYATLQKR